MTHEAPPADVGIFGSLGQSDKSVEEMAKAWGDRPDHRRAYGSPARTELMFALWALKQETEDLAQHLAERRQSEQWLAPPPDVSVPGLDDAIRFLANSWSGELGKENHQFIEALAATRSRAPVQFQSPPQNGGGR